MSTKSKKPVKSKKDDPNEKIARGITEANKTENPTETLKKASIPPVKSETWKDNPKAERSELAEKIEKLDVAINTKKVPQSQVEILTRQTHAMRKYLQILDERLGKL